MAQADYNLANQSGSAFRSELNSTLSAIISLNSGSTAPVTTVAYSLWADTTTGLLKIRDSSNTSFITVGALGSVNLGLAALASPTFTGTPLAPTASAGTNTTQIATTAFVTGQFIPVTGGTITGNITLNAQSDVRFGDADSSNFVALQAPATVAANLTLTLPAADGSSGQALTTNGSGALSFATIGGVPTGAVFYFAASTAPTGFLKANGAAVSRSTYAALFAVTGTTYGSGDGSTTFNLPDLRGEFIRGWDDARGVDASRAFGSAQADGIRASTVAGIARTYYSGQSATGEFSWAGGAGELASNAAQGGNYQINLGSAPETRPRNVALLACIKF